MLPRRACPPGRGRAEGYLLCPAVSAHCTIKPPWRPSGLPWGLFSSNGKGNAAARKHPGTRWLHFQARPGGQPAVLLPCHPMQGMIRRRFAAFKPWPGRRQGRRRSPLPEGRARITSQRRCHKAESRCCLCLLRPISRKKTALRRCMAAIGVPKQEGLLQPAARPSGRAEASASQSLRPSEKAARLCTQRPVGRGCRLARLLFCFPACYF